jgi:hypothetical protein
MKNRWLAGALGAMTMLAAGGAAADISRTAEGSFLFENARFIAEDGTFLGSTTVPIGFYYVTAIGRYGGGDTASGRRTAKARAAQKTRDCMIALYGFGLLGNGGIEWNAKCGRRDYVTVTDPDITLRSNWWAFYTIADVAGKLYCDRARQLAQQFGKTGPVTVSGDVEAFSDNAGTEVDWYDVLGSYVNLCY